MSELAVRHLIQHGAASILVANRTQSRAEAIVAHFQSPGINASVIPFDELYDGSHTLADIVITSTGAPQQLFGRSHGQHFISAPPRPAHVLHRYRRPPRRRPPPERNRRMFRL